MRPQSAFSLRKEIFFFFSCKNLLSLPSKWPVRTQFHACKIKHNGIVECIHVLSGKKRESNRRKSQITEILMKPHTPRYFKTATDSISSFATKDHLFRDADLRFVHIAHKATTFQCTKHLSVAIY